MTNELKGFDDTLDEFDIGETTPPHTGPVLWLGMQTTISRDELIFSLPPRPVVDRLVSRFYNSREAVFSKPTTIL